MIPVACGVLVNAAGEVLVAQRPPGKLAAGKWEFPGGKIEAGESALQALRRELHEELGVSLQAARPLLHFRHDYSDRVVLLDTWLIGGFSGQPEGREGQALAWLQPGAVAALDVLPTVAPILRALRLPQHYVFTPPAVGEPQLRGGLARLPRGCLLRLRLPALDDAAYAALARRLLREAAALGLGLMLDRDPRQAAELGAAGWHATQPRLMALRSRPLPRSLWFAASVHGADSLAQAAQAEADCAVLGPVLATATHPQARPLGWRRFGELVTDASCPVYALGGVGPPELLQAQEHGAQGVAGISAYWGG